MTRRLAASLFATLLGASGTLVAIAVPADAAQPAQRSCVLHLSAKDAKNAVSCYGSFTEAIADATDGRITDAPPVAAIAMSDPRFRARLEAHAASKRTAGMVTKTGQRGGSAKVFEPYEVTLSVHYDHVGYGGVALVASGSYLCTTPTWDVDYQEPNLAATAAFANDMISSYTVNVVGSNCYVRHYEHAGYTGLFTPYDGGTYNIGPALNDKTTSLRWS